MSFVEGFGKSFAGGFSNQMDALHQKDRDDEAADQDLFKIKLQARMAQREKYDERKREDAKFVNQARRIVEQQGLDPKAIPTVAQSLAEGNKEDYVINTIANGKWDFTNATDLNSKPAIDTQTEAALGQPMPGDQAAPEAKKKPSWFQKVINPGGLPEPKPTHRQRMDEIIGNTDDLDQPYQSGYEPNGAVFTAAPLEAEIPDSAAKALVTLRRAQDAYNQDPSPQNQEALQSAQLDSDSFELDRSRDAQAKAVAVNGGGDIMTTGVSVKIPDGQGGLKDTVKIAMDKSLPYGEGYVVISGADKGRKVSPEEFQTMQENVISPQEIEQKNQIRKDISGKPVWQDWQTKKQGLSSMAENMATMDGMVAEDEHILDDGYVAAASTADSIIRNSAAMASGFTDAAKKFFSSKGEEPIAPEAVEQAEAFVKKWGTTQLSNIVDKAALFKARRLLAGYELGRSMGQTGNAVAEKERLAFMDAATAGHDLPTFRKNVGTMIASLESDVDRAGQAVMQDPQVAGFKKDNFYYPIDEVGSWRDEAKQNEKINHILTVTDPNYGAPTRPTPGSPAPAGPAGGPAPTGPAAPPEGTPAPALDRAKVTSDLDKARAAIAANPQDRQAIIEALNNAYKRKGHQIDFSDAF